MLRVERKDNNYLPKAPEGYYWKVEVDQNEKLLLLSLIPGDVFPVISTLRKEVLPIAFDREVLTAQLAGLAESMLKTHSQLAVLESVAGKFYNHPSMV